MDIIEQNKLYPLTRKGEIYLCYPAIIWRIIWLYESRFEKIVPQPKGYDCIKNNKGYKRKCEKIK